MLHPRSFSFDRIKSKVTGRQQQQPSSPSETPRETHRRNSMAVVPPQNASSSPTRRSQSISFMPAPSRTRSRSRSFSNNPASATHHLNPFKSTTKELVKQETAQIISKKLVGMLQDLGLQYPIPLRTTSSGSPSKSIKIYVANTNDCLYLPPATSTSFTYEDVENGGVVPILQDDDEESFHRTSSDTFSSDEIFSSASSPALHAKMKSFKSPNYLNSKIDSENPLPHTFAVIIELTKETTTIKDVNFEFQSLTQILWPNGDTYTKAFAKESFKIGYMQWKTSLAQADYYINNSNSTDVKSKHISPQDLANRTREYQLIDIRDLKQYDQRASSTTSFLDLQSTTTNTSAGATTTDSYKAGLYVFLLPILLPEHIPASIISINGTLTHNLSVNFNKISERLNRKIKVNASYNLPMVRTPPNFANSIADKPIYVNRVWNDAIHYIITFPKKYVSLGNEHVINVKLVPLVKDVIIKRIKFNVLERITYVSQDLRREYDYDSENPFLTHSIGDKVHERLVSLCELRTKNKSSNNGFNEPFKEEVIKCADNNLLFTCYEPEDEIGNAKSSKKKGHHVGNMIASPLDINIALPFLTSRTDKQMLTASSWEEEPVEAGDKSRRASLIMDHLDLSSKESSIIGTLETNLINHDEIGPHEVVKPSSSTYISDDLSVKHKPPENIQRGFTILARALYPDSNYRHIQINHRLQVCFRISKPDPKDNYKMHHYEVVVDTPLILLSSKCNDGSIQLPKYDEIDINDISPEPKISFRTPNYQHNGVSIKQWDQEVTDDLPTFEEAVKQPTGSSPNAIVRSVSIEEDPLSRIPSINIHDPPAYEPSEHIDEVVSSIEEDEDATAVVTPGPSIMKSIITNSITKDEEESIDSSDSGYVPTSIGQSLSTSLSAPPEINISPPSTDPVLVYLDKSKNEFAIDDDEKIAVLGAGISGLTYSYFLHKLRPDLRVHIYEKSAQSSGWINSSKLHVDSTNQDIILEKGPRTLRGVKDGTLLMVDILRDLQLQSEICFVDKKSAANRKYIISESGDIVEIPNSISTLFKFLSKVSVVDPKLVWGVLKEPFVKPKVEDETIEEFIKRRFGSSIVSDNVVSAVIHGIYAGDVAKLSVGSIFPGLKQIEQESGSIIRHLFKKKKSQTQTISPELKKYEELVSPQANFTTLLSDLKNAPMITLQHGLGTLPCKLTEYLTNTNNITFHYNTPVIEIDPVKGIVNGQKYSHIRSTINTHSVGNSLPSTNPLIPHLTSINYVNVFLCNVYTKQKIIPDSGFGFLVPTFGKSSANPQALLGVIYDSEVEKHTIGLYQEKLPSQDSYDKMTIMMGGHYYNEWEVPSASVNLTIVKQILESKLKLDLSKFNIRIVKDTIDDIKPNDLLVSYNYHNNCIPQYE
ncbi:Protoporphyrinogen oxidase [Spathaspora sp. JA1]|nr:Protoporphyrinogen oxidase [Spathaspora sp. JA1]